ncbi:TetR/AcrR family transcriptional regulator [Microbacterium cremeum]|uniref:TetR/AcrR family transcriptional regulator n=1 Tax=Microbacterium cremeum TaxID=2782169 RepID=UPI0018892831|nr:TetR/AcrR family transcriptional regulator C-terminal domain-containing protein [Microbacterium cremeum]
MSDSAAVSFHVGLTPSVVIDAAVGLTRATHLWGWSIRDLARRLDVSPSVIYHHVGGKDLLARHVVERVLTGTPVPSRRLAWQEWFRGLLADLYPRVVSHPGSAKWLLLHGPTFPSVLPIIDTGIGVLQDAGFGDRAAFSYAALLNNAMLTVSIGDERLIHEDDGPRDHGALMAEFDRAGQHSPGVAVLATQFVASFVAGGEPADRERRRYYDFIVDTTIAGLERLPERTEQ